MIPEEVPGRQEERSEIEDRVRRAVRVQDDFVRIPFPRIAATSDRQIAGAVESYKREAAIIDARLSREVTLQQKATALSDLCERLRADTGIQLGAGPSVADEKVSIFCEKLPLRDVMRQLSRPFGYTWLRSGKQSEYRYELVQDLRSQLLEEELRNRDRNAALIALGREIERYRPYLGLSPDEALARSKTAPPAEKPLLEKLSALGWGPIQMYFRLSRTDLEALRAGKELQFVAGDLRSIIGIDLGDRPLPPDVARGVLQSLREWRIRKLDPAYLGVAMDPPEDKGPSFGLWFSAKDAPDAPPPAAVPEASALVTLSLQQSELGQFTLDGTSGLYTSRNGKHTGIFVRSSSNGPCASGVSQQVQQPENAALNAKFAGDPDLHRMVTVRPQPSCRPAPSPAPTGADSSAAAGTELPEAKATMADVYEALYRATGLPIVADQYTRLYKPEEVTTRNRRLFDALSSLADAMRTRWSKDSTWLQFRSTSYYDDRLKEVPNRLLNRWASAKREHGWLTLDEIVEIAQLADAQLDGQEMAEGARECFGLKEWNLARGGLLRNELRYLAQFTPEQRQEMQSPSGLLLSRMSLTQQQGFISRLRSPSPIGSMEELAGATLRVEYTQPGWFTWRMPGSWTRRWVFPMEPGSRGRRALMPSIRERTRDAALQAARRLAPHASEAVLSLMRRADPQFDPAQLVPQPEQIVATDLDLNIVYIPGTINKHFIVQNGTNGNLIDPGL